MSEEQILNPDPMVTGSTGRMLEQIAERVRGIPPLDWLTQNARDAVRIGVAFGGFDVKDLVGRLARVKSRGERLNVATVYRVMAEIADEADARARKEADLLRNGGAS